MVSCKTMIHIEFSGVPGSGKTYLCSLLAERLRLRGIPVVTNPQDLADGPLFNRIIKKSGTIFTQILLHPIWTFQILYIIVSSRQSSIKGILRSFFTIAQVTGTIQKHKNKDGYLLLDQGSIQAYFSLLYGSTANPAGTIDRLIPSPDILLETDGPDSVLLSRLGSRTRVQSRVESRGISGIKRSRDILAIIRKSSLYKTIPEKIPVPDERSEKVLNDITEKIKKRIFDDRE